MHESVSPLMLQFLTWVSSRQRTYTEAMAAWQTSCPRHTIWEDALIDGLIQVKTNALQHEAEVALTPRGKAILDGDTQDREEFPAKSRLIA
jgi:hypothetical protein